MMFQSLKFLRILRILFILFLSWFSLLLYVCVEDVNCYLYFTNFILPIYIIYIIGFFAFYIYCRYDLKLPFSHVYWVLSIILPTFIIGLFAFYIYCCDDLKLPFSFITSFWFVFDFLCISIDTFGCCCFLISSIPFFDFFPFFSFVNSYSSSCVLIKLTNYRPFFFSPFTVRKLRRRKPRRRKLRRRKFRTKYRIKLRRRILRSIFRRICRIRRTLPSKSNLDLLNFLESKDKLIYQESLIKKSVFSQSLIKKSVFSQSLIKKSVFSQSLIKKTVSSPIRTFRRTFSSNSSNSSKGNLDLLNLLGPKGKLTYQESLIKDILSSSECLFIKQKKLLSLRKQFSFSAEYLMKELEENSEKKQQLCRVIEAFRSRFFREYSKRHKHLNQPNRAYYPLIMKFLSCEIKSFLLAQIILHTFSNSFLSSSSRGRSFLPFRKSLPEIGSFALDIIINTELNDFENRSNDNPYITEEYLARLLMCLTNMERAEQRDKIGTNIQDIKNQKDYIENWKFSKRLKEKLKERELKNLRKYTPKKPNFKKEYALKHDFNLVSDDISSLEKKYSLIPCIKSREAKYFGYVLTSVWQNLGLIEIKGGEWVRSYTLRSLKTINFSASDACFRFLNLIDLNVVRNEYSLPFVCVDSLTLNEKRFWQFDRSSTNIPLISNLNSERTVQISKDRMSTMETQVKQPFEICEEFLTNLVKNHKDSFILFIKSMKSTICSQFDWSDKIPFTFDDFVILNKDISSDLELLRSAYKEYVLHEKFFYLSLRICILFSDYRLHFSIFLDFRGRLYLKGWPLNPQGNKNFIRPLFLFPGKMAMTEVDIHAQGIQILSILSWELLGLKYTGLIPFRKKPTYFEGKLKTKPDANPILYNGKPDLYQFFAVKWSLVLNEFISSQIFINTPPFKKLANTDSMLQVILEVFVQEVATRKIVKTLVMFGSYGETIPSQVKRIIESSDPTLSISLSKQISRQSLIMPMEKDGSLNDDLCPIKPIKNIESLLYRFLELFTILKETHFPNITIFIKNLKLLVFYITKINERRNFLKLKLHESFTATLVYSENEGVKFKRSIVVNSVHYIDGLIVYMMLKKIHSIQLLHPEKGIHISTLHDAFFINCGEDNENIDLINKLYKEVIREVFANDLVKILLAANNDLTYSDLARKSKLLATFFEEIHRQREWKRKLLS